MWWSTNIPYDEIREERAFKPKPAPKQKSKGWKTGVDYFEDVENLFSVDTIDEGKGKG